MRVNLIKVAEYELKTDDMSAIPFDVFNRLSDNSGIDKTFDCVRVFNNMKEYNNVTKNEIDETFDETKPIHVNEKGQIFVFLKNFRAENAADTEENKGE